MQVEKISNSTSITFYGLPVLLTYLIFSYIVNKNTTIIFDSFYFTNLCSGYQIMSLYNTINKYFNFESINVSSDVRIIVIENKLRDDIKMDKANYEYEKALLLDELNNLDVHSIYANNDGCVTTTKAILQENFNLANCNSLINGNYDVSEVPELFVNFLSINYLTLNKLRNLLSENSSSLLHPERLKVYIKLIKFHNKWNS